MTKRIRWAGLIFLLAVETAGADPVVSGTKNSTSLVPIDSKSAPQKSTLDQAYAAAKSHDWKNAVKKFEAAKAEKALDYRGLLALGFSYRQLEECSKAVVPLKELQQKANRQKLNKKETKVVRSGLFLLARCYGMNSDVGRALFILNGYLLDPKKYASELRQSLHLIDFGGIRTQSDFVDYEKAARKSMAKIGISTDSLPVSDGDGSGATSPLWNEVKDAAGSGSGTGF